MTAADDGPMTMRRTEISIGVCRCENVSMTSPIPTPMPQRQQPPDRAAMRAASRAGSSIMHGTPTRNYLKRGRTLEHVRQHVAQRELECEGETSLSLPLRTIISAPAPTTTMPASSW